jgi:hypothetical protein
VSVSESDATESASSSRAATLADDTDEKHARSSPAPSVIYFSDSSSAKTCVDDRRRYASSASSASSVTDVAFANTDTIDTSSSSHDQKEQIPFPRLFFAHVGYVVHGPCLPMLLI